MIHSYCLNGYHVVVDAYSCSVHTVDEVAAVAISLYERQPRAAVRRNFASPQRRLAGRRVVCRAGRAGSPNALVRSGGNP